MIQSLKKWVGPGISLILLSVVGGVLFQYMPKNIKIVSSADLFISLSFLVSGMLFQYMLWHIFATVTTRIQGFSETFISHSLMIWSKYIPGKIWSIMGRAGYLARRTGNPLTELLGASTSAQVMMLITGLGCGLTYLLLDNENGHYLSTMDLVLMVSIIAIMVVTLSIYLYIRVDDWRRSWWRLVSAVMISVCTWLLWGMGLSHLIISIGIEGNYWREIGIFSAASSAGIIAVVTPGGLGVREGAMSMLLTWHGMSIGNAALVALVARIWFVVGELILFSAGILIKYGRLSKEA